MEPAPAAVRRDPSRSALAAGIATLCAGMALAIAGVVVPGLFLPGVVAIDLGAVALVAAALLALRDGGGAHSAPGAAPAARAARRAR